MSHICKRFQDVRSQTHHLVSTLQPEDFVVQPVVDVSPPKWHLAHTTWFFEQFILLNFSSNYKAFHPDYNFLFNSYYESVGSRVLRANRGNMTRPGIDEIVEYRQYIDHAMHQLLKAGNYTKEVEELITLGLHHEQQHQELLVTDIKYILGNNPLFPIFKSPNKVNKDKIGIVEKFIDVPEGIYEIGYKGNEFHFDNEKGNHKVFLHSYRYMDRLITNGEYMEFVADDGYGNFEFWLMEGWEWVKANNVRSPMYWFDEDGEWKNYTLGGYGPIDLNAPVTHISYFEADAYAAWRGKRLLTEFEWEVAAKTNEVSNPASGNFVESGNYQPVASVNANHQLFGDVWEWTNSAYLPYPYFKKAKGAVGEYNGKFMVNQKVLRGGSCATPTNHIRQTYRNFFHPNLRWQFTGIRLAENN